MNNALDLAGDDDYVSLPSNIVNPSSAFSAFTWVKLEAKQGTAQIILQQEGAVGRTWLFRYAGSDTLRTYLGNTPTESATSGVRIGAHKAPSADYDYWDGLIDETRIYDRALSASEVETLAGQDFEGFVYDDLGNRVTHSKRAGSDVAYTHNNVNEYTVIGGNSIVHDTARNLAGFLR